MTKTNLEICAEVAAVLNAPYQEERLLAECARCPDLNEMILRDRLAAHRVRNDAAQIFIERYKVRLLENDFEALEEAAKK